MSFIAAVEKHTKDSMAMVCGMSAWSNRPCGRTGNSPKPRNPLMPDRRRYRHSQLPN